jgi:Polyketide cyclase / dehydrase and lipid transport
MSSIRESTRSRVIEFRHGDDSGYNGSMGSSPYVFEHAAHLDVEAEPALVWSHLARFERYPHWWPWLHEFSVVGAGLETGTVLRGVVRPPVPALMRLEVELTERTFALANARVRGDLDGDARLTVEPIATGTRVGVWWNVEVRQPALRGAARLARPLLSFGHDRVVAHTIATFRQNLRRELAA